LGPYRECTERSNRGQGIFEIFSPFLPFLFIFKLVDEKSYRRFCRASPGTYSLPTTVNSRNISQSLYSPHRVLVSEMRSRGCGKLGRMAGLTAENDELRLISLRQTTLCAARRGRACPARAFGLRLGALTLRRSSMAAEVVRHAGRAESGTGHGARRGMEPGRVRFFRAAMAEVARAMIGVRVMRPWRGVR